MQPRACAARRLYVRVAHCVPLQALAAALLPLLPITSLGFYASAIVVFAESRLFAVSWCQLKRLGTV
jgi:hypothetical protein